MRTVQSINKPKFAAYLNNKAFTLIEVLIALSIFSVLAFFMMPIFQILFNSKDSQAELQSLEWEVFCNQIKKEIRLSTKAQVISGRLILTKDGETIQYEKYGSNLRRRVDSTGHEILLQNVSQYSFSIQNNSVKVTVKDLSGKDYSVIAYSIVNWNAAP
ncbi:competence type IV pilus minor pilin ComGF [Paenibacillus sp. BSR1-1]|uniref:competence type IV pilus minor pilin ComGF n=1 Tax=Paenibacillus sp. BSR1-1 TaxID=3020845 RepID=UPI0025AF0A4D|nr:competence type IV pilus minor pilin ComGF [Paenibacillus sp. BSR1-1]MDN3016519.1 competence type IV pilus minor pilin ComGF [Paenibacillus sp. BSR1-1]